MSIGSQIKSARKAKKLTQAQLADLLGIKNTSVSNYEKDFSQPNLDMIKEISKILEVSADYLLELEGEIENLNVSNTNEAQNKGKVSMHDKGKVSPETPDKSYTKNLTPDTHLKTEDPNETYTKKVGMQGHLSKAGKGHLSKKSLDKSYTKKVTPEIIVATQDTSGNITVPLVNYKAMANYAAGYQSQEYFEQLDTLALPQAMTRGRQYYGFQVMGESMMPRLKDSDWVIGRLLDKGEWEYAPDNYVYVVVTQLRGIQVKRCLNRLREMGKLIAKSDSRYHPPIDILEDDILQILRVELMMSSNLANDNDTVYYKMQTIEERLMEIEKRLME